MFWSAFFGGFCGCITAGFVAAALGEYGRRLQEARLLAQNRAALERVEALAKVARMTDPYSPLDRTGVN